MKPPRYLLRESLLKTILGQLKPGKFLEIGYGEGHMLVTMARLGYWGDGYDFSNTAKEMARNLVKKHDITKINLLDRIDPEIRYDYILFFEVIGYWKDPANEIARLKALLNPGGKIIFSFSNQRFEGYAEKVTGNMKCFKRDEIIRMLEDKTGLKVELIWNFGFPLVNVTKPVLDYYHRWRVQSRPAGINMVEDIKGSGLSSQLILVNLVSMLLNPVTIYPFTVIQSLFRKTDLGNGYIVVASPHGTQKAN
jgi:SAM-dependent methyltransferase